jgi:hypothetical protein
MRDQDVLQATRRKLTDGVLAGLVATLMMSALVLAIPALAGGRMPPFAARLIEALRGHPLIVVLIVAAHLAYGSLAGGLFSVGARRISVSRGVIYALGLWGVAATLYAPLLGLGFVAARVPGLAALLLPAHLLYGVALGATAPRGEIVQPLDDRLAAG